MRNNSVVTDIKLIDARTFSHVLRKLKYWVDNNPKEIKTGICANVRNAVYIQNVLGISWTDWPEYSGNFQYPVCTGNYRLKVCGPYSQFQRTTYYFNPDSQYGQARTRLLNWIIEQVELKITELEEQNA